MKHKFVELIPNFFTLTVMMQKINSWAPRHSGWTMLWMGLPLWMRNLRNELSERVTHRCGASQTATNA